MEKRVEGERNVMYARDEGKPTFVLKRTSQEGKNTFGSLYAPNGDRLCYTCEDVIREVDNPDTVQNEGIKVHGETAIPAILYNLGISYSLRFKKYLPIIYTEPDRMTINACGVKFTGVRIHGGSDHTHSEGCPLVGMARCKKGLTRTLEASKEVTRVVMLACGHQPKWDVEIGWWMPYKIPTPQTGVLLSVQNAMG